MKFDSKINSTAFFIRRFKKIANIKKEQAMFWIFFMCLKSSTLEWHINLFLEIRVEMNVDFKIWKDKLLREYRFNRFKFLKKTKNLNFRFDESFTISQYLSRKINLLHDVEISDQDTMIRYLWNNLNVRLVLVIAFKNDDEILKSFKHRVKQNKSAARKIHELKKKSRFYKTSDQRKRTYERKSRYASNLFLKRIEKLLSKLEKHDKDYVKKKKKSKIKILRKSLIVIADNFSWNSFFRFCKHCDNNHWNRDCKNKKLKEEKKIFFNKTEKENFDLDDEDIEILKFLKKILQFDTKNNQ